jgi:hypothetical protein
MELLTASLDCLAILSSTTSFSQLISTSLASLLNCQQFHTASCLGIWVEFEESSQVAERVLLEWGTGLVVLWWVDNALHFITVDETGKIWVTHDVTGQLVATLDFRSSLSRAKDLVELLESRLRPDAEATEVSTWGQLQEVEAVDRGDVNTRDVTEGTGDATIGTIDDEWSLALDITTVAHLTLTTAEVARSRHSVDVSLGTNILQNVSGLLGLGDSLSGVRDDEGDLWDGFNAVTAGHDEGWEGRGSEGRDDGITLLVDVDFAVPLAPCLGWGEHVTATDHVTESSLACRCEEEIRVRIIQNEV